MTEEKYTYQTEDESLHNLFAAYVVTAIRRQKARYLMKKSREQKMVVSLDEMLESNMVDPALITFFDEMDRLFDSEATLENIICNDMLLIGILKLSDRERRILNLRLVRKMKHEEIADLLGLNKNTVEKAYERLIKKLRAHMRGEKGEEF